MGFKRCLEKVGTLSLREKEPVVRMLNDKLHDAFVDGDVRLLAKANSESCFQVFNTMIAENKEK